MAANTKGGTTTSFSKMPQAKDDNRGEDSLRASGPLIRTTDQNQRRMTMTVQSNRRKRRHHCGQT